MNALDPAYCCTFDSKLILPHGIPESSPTPEAVRAAAQKAIGGSGRVGIRSCSIAPYRNMEGSKFEVEMSFEIVYTAPTRLRAAVYAFRAGDAVQALIGPTEEWQMSLRPWNGY